MTGAAVTVSVSLKNQSRTNEHTKDGEPRRMRMSVFIVCGVVLSVVASAQRTEPLSVGGVSLGMTYSAFRTRWPNTQCMRHRGTNEMTCHLSGEHLPSVLGVKPSAVNYNFEGSTVADISMWFFPPPAAKTVSKMVADLTREFGSPKKIEILLAGDAYRWTTGGADMTLILPKGKGDDLELEVCRSFSVNSRC
jgi:hypothetical protein